MCRSGLIIYHKHRAGGERRHPMIIANIAREHVLAAVVLVLLSLGDTAQAGGTLRIGMTASDVPTTTGAPDNGFEGMRFFGSPVFDGLVLWVLTHTDRPPTIRPGLSE